MITAKEALSNLDTVNKDATTFIEEIIEPKIRQAMKTDTSIMVGAVDFWYYGTVYNAYSNVNLKSVTNKEYPSKQVTEKINEILKENGYTVNVVIQRYGNEYMNGYGYFDISWDKADVTEDE